MNQKIKRKQSNAYSKLVSFFLFLTIAAIIVVLHFALAKVNIKIYNDLQDKELSVLVEIQSENIKDISADALLGKILSIDLELKATVPSSQEVVNSGKAGGYVTIYNNYSKKQTLVKTTRLLNPANKLFHLTEAVSLASGESIEVWVEADQEGEDFVIDASTFIIPGLWKGLQDKIYAESKSAMTMESIPRFNVTQENLDLAQTKIKEQAIQQGLDTINQLLSDNLKIQAKQLTFDFITNESSSLGEESKETSLDQTVTVYAVIFEPKNLIAKAQEKFSKEISTDQSIVKFYPEKFNYQILELNLEKNKAILEVNMGLQISSNESVSDVKKKDLIGLDEQGIREYFQQFKTEGIEIRFSPFWVKKAPRLQDHIIIE